LAAYKEGKWEDYLAWTAESHGTPSSAPEREPKTAGFRLESVREDGYRIYGHTPPAEAAAQTQETRELAMLIA
jgi:hypothetical protein